MKKNIIIAAIAAASALLLSVSCQKENQPESQDGINAGANTFTATIEQSITKTTITDYKVNWTSTDKISINGKIYTASPKDDDATKADFTADDGEATAVDGKFKAIYPSTLYVTDHFELPAIQVYTADEFNAPMYAQSTTQTLSFKNICAVLAIKVTSDDIATLRSIKVKSDKAMCGTFTVTDNQAVLSDDADATKAVVLESTSAMTLDATGTIFYIAIPAQDYSNLKIYLSEDGNLYKRAMITKKAVGTVSCNKIYSIDYETNAVQINENGPYWSIMNIGSTTETEFGLYFAWGEKTGHAPTGTNTGSTFVDGHTFSWANAPFNGGKPNLDVDEFNKHKSTVCPNDILSPEYDAATVYWGSGWRMPNGGPSGEFDKMKNNTTAEWVSPEGVAGMEFTGKNSYSDITLFFPAAGHSQNDKLSVGTGFYWARTLENNEFARRLYFEMKNVYIHPTGGSTRYDGVPIRPVSD